LQASEHCFSAASVAKSAETSWSGDLLPLILIVQRFGARRRYGRRLRPRIGVLGCLACFADLLDDQIAGMFLHDTFDVSTLVARDDQEPAGVIADSLVGGDRYRQRRRAVGIRAFAEEFDGVVAEFLAEPLEPFVHFAKDVLVQSPPFGTRHDPDPIEAAERAPGLTRLLRGVIFHRTVFDYAEYRFWPMAAGIQRNDPRAFLRAQGG